MKHKKIAIIGAGIAGASLAHRLLKADYQVTIYEKNSGTGGRQSSCRIGKDSADIGAPWFEPKTDLFRQWLIGQPNVIRWHTSHSDFSGAVIKPKLVYLSSPRQLSLSQSLIKGAMLYTGANITAVTPGKFGVQLQRGRKKINCFYDAVIVTTPASQATPLLSPSPQFSHTAASTRKTPSWVVVISLKERSGIAPDIFSGPHSALFRATRDSSKPGRNSWSRKEIWVLEANTAWSEKHIKSDQNTIARALIKAFESVIKQPIETSNIRVHQWLCARHQTASAKYYLWDEETSIGVCSDWLNSSGSEGAWLSANALADHLLSYTRASDFYPVHNIAFT